VEERLLASYARHGRDLAWRRTRDPYAILVSEVMLQQTQMGAGRPAAQPRTYEPGKGSAPTLRG
jgi:A/G-specific adenine glycosylase